MKQTQTLRDYYNRIIGYIETDTVTGDKIGRDFYQRIVGYYEKNRDVTTDFYRVVVGRGDMLASLVLQAEANNKK